MMCLAMSVFYTRNKFTTAGAIVGVAVVYAHWLLSVKAFAAVLSFGILGTLSSSFKKRYTRRHGSANNDSANVNANIGSRLAININVCLKNILAYNGGDVSPMSCQWE